MNLSALILVLGLAQSDDGPWIDLFDGKSLSGWSGDESFWRVEDGAIIGQSTPENPLQSTTYLICDEVRAADFEFECSFRIRGGNSGVQFRTERNGERSVRGYQADLEDGPNWTGCLYEQDGRGVMVRRGERATFAAGKKKEVTGSTGDSKELLAKAPAGEWNRYQIRAVGNVVELSINDTLMCTLEDNDPARTPAGLFCVQLHQGPPMKVEFKDLRVRHIGDPPAQETAAEEDPEIPRWIWRDEDGADDERGWFRKRFTIEREVKRAEFWMSCDNQGEAYFNGKRALQNVRWEQPSSADVTKRVKTGENWIAVSMKNQGGPAALLAELTLEYADGSTEKIKSDASWRTSGEDQSGWKTASFDDASWDDASDLGAHGSDPWGRLPGPETYIEERALDGSKVTVPEGFRCELVYSVPKHEQGSWVSMCFDERGRMYACDQYGRMYRLTMEAGEPVIELLDIPLGEAQGMCFLDGVLYVIVSGKGGYKTGLYKVTDSNGDGDIDEVSILRLFSEKWGGEHGPHGVIPGPGFKPGETGLWIIAGNHTPLPEPIDESRVPQVWGEDQLLPRSPDARGHAVGYLAPGGWAVQTDIEANHWVLHSMGMRNAYDIAFNSFGDLFTFDSDMEYDVGLPWYRPTRVSHLVSGSESGWRNGNGKWPEWAPDSLPGVADIGLSSPTGINFGYGAAFPTNYQDALYVADWAYGTIYAVHLESEGASYKATSEAFAVGKPLPVTDTAVGPDGALWFTTGGRRTQSGVYRITYTGGRYTPNKPKRSPIADLRVQLEALHEPGADGAVEAAWPHLSHPDRYIRFAARTAIEHQDPALWQERALSESEMSAAQSLIALARCGDPSLRTEILAALAPIRLGMIDAVQPDETIAILRAYELTFTRMGTPNDNAALIEKLEAAWDTLGSWDPAVTRELTKLLVHLGSEEIVANALTVARNTEDVDLRLAIVFTLRHAYAGWTLDLRRTWLELCKEAQAGSGGSSYQGYLDSARKDVLAGMSEGERFVLGELAAGKVPVPEANAEPTPLVHDWTREELNALAAARGGEEELREAGLKAFKKARCAECHRFEQSGGAKGPDLTGARRRFSATDLVETLVAPSSTISDQYADEVFELGDDQRIIGRLLMDSEGVYVIEAVYPEEAVLEVDAVDVKSRTPYGTSRMPEDLLDVLSEAEVQALFTLLLGSNE
ncbi:MAG: DUF1080 domain-containing protein [Planctomycetes bacterium]|nr:DUF1080 domain-containing protein [Planctomycetota bacterium]